MPQSLRAALLILLAAGPVAAHAQDAHAERIARIERRLWPAVTLEGTSDSGWSLAERMRAHDVAGVSVAMVHGARVAWARAYGVRDRATGAPMTANTLLQAGSLSKPVAAALALRLVQDGVVALDEDVNRWLRAWRVPLDSFTAAQPVTLRLLLSHRAGINVRGFDGYARGAVLPTVAQVLRGAPPATSEAVRVVRRPGSGAAYSGGGYLIAQQVLHDATGVPFDRLAHARVLAPLGLTRSTFAPMRDDANGGDVARGYLARGAPVPGGWRELPEQAPASLWTTASEYAAFVAELQRAAGGDTGRLLAPQTAQSMMTLQGSPADQQGIGVGLKGTPPFRFSHTGWNDGFQGIMIGYLDRPEGIVVLTNADNGDALAMELVRSVAREYGWEDLAPTVRRAVPLSPADRRGMLGRYQLGADWAIEIAERDGALVAGPVGRALMPLHAAARDDFFFVFADGLRITVERDSTGVVQRLTWHQGERTTSGGRVRE